MPCEAWWEPWYETGTNGEKIESKEFICLLVGCRRSKVDGAAPLPSNEKGDGLDDATRESIITIAVTEGVKHSPTDGEGAIIEKIRKHRLSKLKKEPAK